MEAFTVSLTGLGAQITTGLTALGPIFLAVAGLVVAGAVLRWGVGLFKGAMGGGKR